MKNPLVTFQISSKHPKITEVAPPFSRFGYGPDSGCQLKDFVLKADQELAIQI